MGPEIFRETLMERRRSILWWSLGIVSFVALQIVFYPSIRDSTGLNEYTRHLSDAMRALFVGGETDITSGIGYLNSQIFAFAGPLLLLIFAIGIGGSLIAGDEENGAMELTLSHPLSRAMLVRQQFGFLTLAVAAVSFVLFTSVLLLSLLVDLEIGTVNLLAATISVALLGLLFGTLALAIGAVVPGKARAISVAGAIGVASWALDGLGQAVSALDPWRPLSPFYQALGSSPLRDGAPWGGWAILVALTVALAVVAVAGLNRRDIGQ